MATKRVRQHIFPPPLLLLLLATGSGIYIPDPQHCIEVFSRNHLNVLNNLTKYIVAWAQIQIIKNLRPEIFIDCLFRFLFLQRIACLTACLLL
jgi:hypothetical protein